MSARSTTYTLAGIAIGLLLLDVAAHTLGDAGPEDLPGLVAVPVDEAVAIAVNKGDTRVELTKRDDGWWVTAPFEFRADPGAVAAVLEALADGIDMDVRVDEGPDAQKTYGLKPPDEIRVHVEHADGGVADFYVGNNGQGGATFVRLPGSEVVYSARIGGRARYDRMPSQWRDSRVWRFEPDELVALRAELPDGTWTAARSVDVDEEGTAKPGVWKLREDPAFRLDQKLLDQLAVGLGEWRSLRVFSPDHSAGMDAPLFTLQAELSNGSVQRVQLGRTGKAVFAQADPGQPVYRVQPQITSVFADPSVSWRDKQLLDLDPTAVAVAQLVEPDLLSVLERTEQGWSLVQPPNLTINAVQTSRILAALPRLRIEAWVDISREEAGLPSEQRFVLTTTDGADVTVEVGGPVPGQPEGRELVYVARTDDPEAIGVMPAANWPAIRRAWGR